MRRHTHRGAAAAVWSVLAAAAAIVAVLAPGASASCGGFENPCSAETAQQFGYGSVQREDRPNDPNYDQSEPKPGPPSSSDFFKERFDLFGFPSELTHNAVYAVGPHAGKPMVAGFNAAGAWKAERGRPDTVIAILDTGIDWGHADLRDQIHLNTGELPYPQDKEHNTHGTYDLNGDGVINVEDYAEDPRVSLSYPGRIGPAGLITAQDLIHAFGNCKIDSSTHLLVECVAGQHFDNDGNGFANDIAGWNFFDNNNDPTDLSSYFAAHHHGTGRAADAADQGNNGQGSLGVCPHCQIMPIRIWDTFVSDGNTFGLGILYATDNGAKVVEGANGSLYHSAFAEAASQYAYDHGVVQTFSGDDLNTGNHNYPANYAHAMLIQGTVPDSAGELGESNKQWLEGEKLCGATGQPACFGSNEPVQTFFRGANTTQYGGKSSISMEGATGSVNTSKASGAAGLVVAAGLDHGIALRPDETRELLEQTAERVLSGNTEGTGVPDPAANPLLPADQQWTPHFGWGRADVGGAVGAVVSGNIPPEAAINAPDWYAPLTGSSVEITGLARARFATGGQFHWKLMWGVGQAPASWTTAAEGDSNGTVSDFGSIDLEKVRTALATFVVPPDSGGPTFAASEPNPYQHEFTVQLEVSGQGIPLTGIDRRMLNTFTDPTLRPGYPKRMGTGGESPTRYADLLGNNEQELIVPSEDGLVHAFRRDGTELPRWPVHTETEQAALGHSGSPGLAALGLPREPPRGPLVADLDGDGEPEVIVAAGTHIYAWHEGKLVPGFPVSSNPAFCGPALENDHSHPKCGFLAAPALAHLEGFNKGPDIVEPSLDGHLYAWHANGKPVAGYPVALVDPKEAAAGHAVIAESINDPAIGDVTGAGHDDIVVASNEVYGTPAVVEEVNFKEITVGSQGSSGRLYAIDGKTGKILPGWPVAITGIIQNVLPLVGPGQDAEIGKIGGETVIVASVTGGALEELSASGKVLRTMQQTGSQAFGAASDATDHSGALNLFENASIGDLLGTGTPNVVKYELSLGDAANLLLVGQNFPYNHLIGAWDGSTGAPLPTFPTITDDFQFLSANNIAKIDPTLPSNQIVAGTGLGLLHAYDGASGLDVPGFPKVTGGWLPAPAALSFDGRMAAMTREGYLFEWQTKAPACQSEWPSFRHDPQDSGNYNHDGTPPGGAEKLTLEALGSGKYRLTFIAPGDNGLCGTPAAYRTFVNQKKVELGLHPVAGGSPFSAEITLPAGSRKFALQAIDAAGNLGPAVAIAVP